MATTAADGVEEGPRTMSTEDLKAWARDLEGALSRLREGPRALAKVKLEELRAELAARNK